MNRLENVTSEWTIVFKQMIEIVIYEITLYNVKGASGSGAPTDYYHCKNSVKKRSFRRESVGYN